MELIQNDRPSLIPNKNDKKKHNRDQVNEVIQFGEN